MDASSSRSATPRFKDADAPSVPSVRQRWQVIGVVVIVVLASVGACRQFTAPYEWHEPREVGNADWWINPIDWNVDAGLPDIVGTINAVELIGSRLIVAGNTGLLAYSEDDGRSWTQLRYQPDTQEFRAGTAAPRPTAMLVPETSGLNPLRFLVATVLADAGIDGPDAQAPSTQGAPNPASQQPTSPQPPSPGDVTSSVPRYDFKGVQVGETAGVPIEFRNPTSKRLSVPPPLLYGDTENFSITNSRCELPLGQFLPGSLCSVTIAFSPKTTGDLKSQLTFGTVLVPLSGAGLAGKPAAQTSKPSPAQQSPPQPSPTQPSPTPPTSEPSSRSVITEAADAMSVKPAPGSGPDIDSTLRAWAPRISRCSVPAPTRAAV